jgi:DNA-binding FrmR family transcriptional regulator
MLVQGHSYLVLPGYLNCRIAAWGVRVKADKEKIIKLLRTARGQIDGILNMIDEDRYCIDISNQIIATEAILHKANREVLHTHIDTCVKEAIESGNTQEKLDEIRNIVDKLTK